MRVTRPWRTTSAPERSTKAIPSIPARMERTPASDERPILAGIEGIAFVDLSGADVVRHGLVTRIVAAYDEAERKAEARRRGGASETAGERPAAEGDTYGGA